MGLQLVPVTNLTRAEDWVLWLRAGEIFMGHFKLLKRSLKQPSYCVQPRLQWRPGCGLAEAAQQSQPVQREKAVLPLPSGGHDSTETARFTLMGVSKLLQTTCLALISFCISKHKLRTFLRSNLAKSKFFQLFERSLNFNKEGNYKKITKILFSNGPKTYQQSLCSEGKPWQ